MERAVLPSNMSTHSPLALLRAGDLSPDFTLLSTDNEKVTLYEQLEHSSVVLFFFLKAYTPICVSEVCGFRSHASEFARHNAAIFGISSDSLLTARRFHSQFKLPYPLLSDESGRVRDLYRVPKTLGFIPGRSTFLISQDRTVAHVTHSQFSGQPHIGESLRFLAEQK